jgi:endonuclease-3
MDLSRETDPVKIERDLMRLIPEQDWINFSHAMIWHGRDTCTARKPDCPNCLVNKLCPKLGVTSTE